MAIRDQAGYWDDPYKKEFDAKVESIQGNQVVLDRTYFYPTSGGQIHDVGTINSINVSDVRFNDTKSQIIHFVSDSSCLSVGQIVSCTIDWTRRYACMKLHSTQHLVYSLFRTLYGSVSEAGGAITPDNSKVGLAWFGEKPDVTKLQEEINKVIVSNLPITTRFQTADASDPSRTWSLEGFEDIPCGGTHVRSTGEIGKVSLKFEKMGRQGIRFTARIS